MSCLASDGLDGEEQAVRSCLTSALLEVLIDDRVYIVVTCSSLLSSSGPVAGVHDVHAPLGYLKGMFFS